MARVCEICKKKTVFGHNVSHAHNVTNRPWHPNLQRVRVKKMLAEWEKEYPGRAESIFRSIRNVAPSQLADVDLFEFSSLKAGVDTNIHLPGIKAVNL